MGWTGAGWVVETFPREFVLTAGAQPPVDVVRAALAEPLSVTAAGRPRTLRRTWLDTFDWRLHAAGLTFEHITGSHTSQFTLTGENGDRLTVPASPVRWPALASALPPGALRSRLQPVTSVRALLPAARALSTVQRLRVLNADRKTVAWLTVSSLATAGPERTELPARVSVTAVRGYQAQAGRIIRQLTAAAGLVPASCSPLAAALAAAGRRPGEYTSKVDVELTAAMPAADAVQAVLLRLLDTLAANVAGAIRDIDTEFLHDLRVAVRRTRSALKLCGEALPPGLAGAYRGEFKWLGDVTTPIRDLDVYLLGYDGMAAGLRAATPAELAPFHRHLAARRKLAQAGLARALRSRRLATLQASWRAELTSGPARRRTPTAGPMAAQWLRRAHRRVLRAGSAITADSPPESLHDLRKRCKELRYLLEFFASLHDPAAHRQAVRNLKGLQDCLGEYQDCQVQRHEIRMFATQMRADPAIPATALLAMGELAGQIALREQRAREEFAGRFADFASPASRQRFATLTAGASG